MAPVGNTRGDNYSRGGAYSGSGYGVDGNGIDGYAGAGAGDGYDPRGGDYVQEEALEALSPLKKRPSIDLHVTPPTPTLTPSHPPSNTHPLASFHPPSPTLSPTLLTHLQSPTLNTPFRMSAPQRPSQASSSPCSLTLLEQD